MDDISRLMHLTESFTGTILCNNVCKSVKNMIII